MSAGHKALRWALRWAGALFTGELLVFADETDGHVLGGERALRRAFQRQQRVFDQLIQRTFLRTANGAKHERERENAEQCVAAMVAAQWRVGAYLESLEVLLEIGLGGLRARAHRLRLVLVVHTGLCDDNRKRTQTQHSVHSTSDDLQTGIV